MPTTLAHRLGAALKAVSILPRRMLLETPGVLATVPMLRGVWGAALHDLDPEVYAAVFAPNEQAPAPGPRRATSGSPGPPHRIGPRLAQAQGLAADSSRTPLAVHAGGTASAGYVLRPAPPDPDFAPAIDWILVGGALAHDFALCRAWDIASGMGLGPKRRRFHIRRVLALLPDGAVADQAAPWPLGAAVWHVPGRAGGAGQRLAPDQPCSLVFPAPLRLMYRGRLVEQPSLADIVVAACRRVETYLPPEQRASWADLAREALDTARNTPAGPWQGQRLDLRRYSARQHAEVELRGVAGRLDLPRGPGHLAPLLAAAMWLHLGKGTVMGLGQCFPQELRHD